MAVLNHRLKGPSPEPREAVDRRALSLWPRLDRRALNRCQHDPDRIARLVARRTSLDPTTIRALLTLPSVSDQDVALWFG